MICSDGAVQRQVCATSPCPGSSSGGSSSSSCRVKLTVPCWVVRSDRDPEIDLRNQNFDFSGRLPAGVTKVCPSRATLFNL